MKHKIQKVELFIGVIIFLGGLLTYGLGVHQLLPVPRPDLVVYGTTLIGIILIFMGCDIFSKPTKEMQILENDERNIAITNASLANAYKVTLTLLVLVLFALVFMGYMSKVVFFSIAGVIAIGQITWVITARYYNKIFRLFRIQPLRKNLPQTGDGDFHRFSLIGFFLRHNGLNNRRGQRPLPVGLVHPPCL